MPMGGAFHSWLRLDSLTPRYVWGLLWGICTNEHHPAQTDFEPKPATSLQH